MEFALEVNRINAQEHGYLNITDTEIAAEGSVSPQVQFLHEMEARAGGRDAFLFSALDQETGDAWGNTVKQFFAGELSEQEFLKIRQKLWKITTDKGGLHGFYYIMHKIRKDSTYPLWNLFSFSEDIS